MASRPDRAADEGRDGRLLRRARLLAEIRHRNAAALADGRAAVLGAGELALVEAVAYRCDGTGHSKVGQEALCGELDRGREWVGIATRRIEAAGIATVTRSKSHADGKFSTLVWHFPALDMRQPARIHAPDAAAVSEAPTRPMSESGISDMDVHVGFSDDIKEKRKFLSTGRSTRATHEKGATVVDLETAALAKRLQRSSSKPWRLATASRVVEEAVARAGIDAVRHVAEEDLIGAGLPPWEIAARLEAIRPPKAMTGTESLAAARGNVAGPAPMLASTPQNGATRHDAHEAKQPLASLTRALKSAADLEVERLAVRYIDQLDPITRNVVWFNRARAAGCPSNRSHDTASWAPWVAYQFLEENHHRALAKIVAEAVVL